MLGIDGILSSRAFTLDFPPTAPPEPNMNFKCWYEPHFPLEGEYLRLNCKLEHCEMTPRLQGEINELAQNIGRHGLRNPVIVTGMAGMWNLHPGKCRAAAMKMRGFLSIPAVVIDYDHHLLPDTALYEITTESQFQAHFTGDLEPTFNRRFARTPRKR